MLGRSILDRTKDEESRVYMFFHGKLLSRYYWVARLRPTLPRELCWKGAIAPVIG